MLPEINFSNILLVVIFLFIILHFYTDFKNYMKVGTFIEAGPGNMDDNDTDDDVDETIDLDTCESLLIDGNLPDGKKWKKGLNSRSTCIGLSTDDCEKKCFEAIEEPNPDTGVCVVKKSENMAWESYCQGKTDEMNCNNDPLKKCIWGSALPSNDEPEWNQQAEEQDKKTFKKKQGIGWVEGGLCKPKCQEIGYHGNCADIEMTDAEGNPNGIFMKQCPQGCPYPDLSKEPTDCTFDTDCLGCKPQDLPMFDTELTNPNREISSNAGPGPDGSIDIDGQQMYRIDGRYVNYNNYPATDEYASRIIDDELIEKIFSSDNNLFKNDEDIENVNRKDYLSRVGDNILNKIVNVRNLDTPEIDESDKELLGRAFIDVSKANYNNNPTAIKAMRQRFKRTVQQVFSQTTLTSEDISWETPKQTSALSSTTGMFNDTSNRLFGIGDKSQNNSEKPDGGLCLWKGCENWKRKPYDSIWSLY